MNRTGIGRRARLASLTSWFALAASLAHCSLDAQGRAGAVPEPFAGPGGGAGFGGAVGGEAGAVSGGGAGGAAGSTNVAGEGGAAGAAGASGGGGGGGGEGPPACDASRGEFALAGVPASCLIVLAKGSPGLPPGGTRDEWSWFEARDDCNALGARFAAPAAADEYEALRAYFNAGGGEGVAVDDSVWIGGSTDVLATPDPAPSALASSFRWEGGEPWTYGTPGEPPWAEGEPGWSSADPERCVEMRVESGFAMNNRRCDDRARFALCERDRPTARGR